MPEIKIKKLITKLSGIKLSKSSSIIFELTSLKLISKEILTFKPAMAFLKTGWIIDGLIFVTDDGTVPAEGFHWTANNVAQIFKDQNERLKVKSSPENLSISGIENNKIPIVVNREINDDEVTDAIFLSGFNNLSHFMMEIAPKSLLIPKILEENPNIKTIATSYLVPKKWIEYIIKVAESLTRKKFGLKIKQFNPDKAIRFKNIITITSTTYRGSDTGIRMSIDEAKSFSQQMCKNAADCNNSDPYILYLSRKHASHRRTLNQDNLIKITKKVFPKFKFVLEDQIHKLSMENQARLIYNASIIIEEGGGSTGFTTNLIGENVPYICIASSQRKSSAGKIYMAGLGKYAAWFLGDPVGDSKDSSGDGRVDNDIQVNEKDFENLLTRLSLFVEKKIPMPTI